MGKGVTALTTKKTLWSTFLLLLRIKNLLFFTNKGKVYRKVYEIPEAGRQAKGTAIINLAISGRRKLPLLSVQEFVEDVSGDHDARNY